MLQLGKNPSSFICLAATSASSAPAVPDLRREEPRKPVYVDVALVVGDVAPLTRDDDRQLGPVLRSKA